MAYDAALLHPRVSHRFAAEAKRQGITVGRGGNQVTVRRPDWKNGRPVIVVVGHPCFKKAIRALGRAIPSLQTKAAKMRKSYELLRRLQAVFRAKMATQQKQQQALSTVSELKRSLRRVRAPQLRELRRFLAAPRTRKRSLERLVIEKNWQAACAKIVYRLIPKVEGEHRRVSALPTVVRSKRELLTNWLNHETRVAEFSCTRLAQVVKQSEDIVLGKRPLGNLLADLTELAAQLGGRFDIRYGYATSDLRAALKGLTTTGRWTRKSHGRVRAALVNLTDHLEWLHKSGVLPASKKRGRTSGEQGSLFKVA